MKILFGKVEQFDVFNNKRSWNIEQTQMKNINVVNNEWQTNLYTKSKLRTFFVFLFNGIIGLFFLRTYHVLFKENYCTVNYVKYCMFHQQRPLITQLTLGIVPFHIETGRFRRTQLDDMICQLCDTQEVDNQKIHFVWKCNLYNNLREIT